MRREAHATKRACSGDGHSHGVESGLHTAKVGETTDRSGPPIGARARAWGLDVYEGGEAKGRAPLTGPVYRRRGADGLLGELG